VCFREPVNAYRCSCEHAGFYAPCLLASVLAGKRASMQTCFRACLISSSRVSMLSCFRARDLA
jgi:hypothetical protein